MVVPDADVLREKKIVNAGDLVRFEMEGRSVGLPAHKRVLGYEVWIDPLPRTTTGKLKRFEIERRVREHEATRDAGTVAPLGEADRAWTESPDVAPILAVIAGAARDGAPARPDANLELDLGLDSMERVELLTALEQRFGARVPEERRAADLHRARTRRGHPDARGVVPKPPRAAARGRRILAPDPADPRGWRASSSRGRSRRRCCSWR